MMDLKMEVYSPFLELLGLLEIQNSVMWENKAFSAGSFTLNSLITEESKTLLVPENIIWIAGDDAGIIEYVQQETGEDGPYITVKGCNLTGALGRYILWGPYNLTGPVPEIMRRLVDNCCIHPTLGDFPDTRIIPNLVLSDEIDASGPSIRSQKTGGNLLDTLEELGTAYGVPFGVRFNPAVPCMEFWARYGVNRSIHQDSVEPVFYSTELDDVLSSEYSYNSQNWRNVALVAGEGEGNDRVMVIVNGDVEPAPEPPTPPTPTKYTITLSVDPEGGGVASGGGTVSEGQSVTITATPSSGYEFAGWREDGIIVSTGLSYTFTVTADRALTAVFAVIVPAYTVSASIDPEGSGTVTGSGTYKQGQTVTLTADPGEDYKFAAWTENGKTVSESAEYTFTVTGNRELVAVFAVKSRLPEGYTELEYVRTFYDTKLDIKGVVLTSNTTHLIMDITPTEKVSTYRYLFIGTNSNLTFVTALRQSNVTNKIDSMSGYYANTTTGIFYNLASNVKVTVDFNNAEKYVKFNSEAFTINADSSNKTGELRLGGVPNVASSMQTLEMKIHYCKCYIGGILKADLVPCRKEDDAKLGLYNLVNNTFCTPSYGKLESGPAV